jgi:hypothetical protein
MNDIILETGTLPEPLSRMVGTARVRARQTNSGIQLIPVEDEKAGCSLHGFLARYQDYTVDSFLRRKHADKTLDL